MWNEIAAWQEQLNLRPDLSAKTIALYTQDARRFATWLQQEHPGLKATEVTSTDAKTYRDHLLTKRYAPTTINRALISLMLFFDTAVARRDHGLAFALATLFRYAGPRVSEVAALQIPDVQISVRRGLLIIRRGKGLKHREIPLVQEAREPLDAYFTYREHLAEQWRERAAVRGETVAAWSRWPDGHLFLGQRGPLVERGIREIIAKLGQAAKLPSPLGPHDLRHTFAKALLDPTAYGLDRPPMPLPAIQQLLGHADIATTTIYTRVSADDLARMMGTSEAP